MKIRNVDFRHQKCSQCEFGDSILKLGIPNFQSQNQQLCVFLMLFMVLFKKSEHAHICRCICQRDPVALLKRWGVPPVLLWSPRLLVYRIHPLLLGCGRLLSGVLHASLLK